MYNNLISEDYLIHHGVKGMKWGVRKQYQPLGRVRRLGQNSQSLVRNQQNSVEARKKRSKRNLKRGAIVAGVILGTAAGAVLIKKGLDTRKVKAGLNYINANPNFDSLTKQHYRSLNKKQQLDFIKNRLNSNTQKRLTSEWSNRALRR